MENENATCGVCAMSYDADAHIPRVLISCGHTLCSSCLNQLIKNSDLRKCPFDNLALHEAENTLDHFPKNFALLALIEGTSRTTCHIHGEKLVLFCLQDKVKICCGCALLGEHQGHSYKKITELKAQRAKVKKDLEERLANFEKHMLEKDQEAKKIKKEYLSKIGKKFGRVKRTLDSQELKSRKEINNLFERNFTSNSNDLELKKTAERMLEEINQADDLAILEQDLSSIITSLQPEKIKEEEASKFEEEASKTLDYIESFLDDQEKSIKSFDLRNKGMIKDKLSSAKGTQQPSILEAETRLTFRRDKESLFIDVMNPTPIEIRVDLGEFNGVEKVYVELEQYESFSEGSADFNFLGEILSKLDHYTSLSVSFAPENLADDHVLNLLTCLFCRIQQLTEIEISLEGCEIADEPILFFCKNLLPKTASLKRFMLKLTRTFISDDSLFGLAKSLSPFSRNLETFTLGIGYTAITSKGFEKIIQVISGVKELHLELQGTLLTDVGFVVLGHVMRCMKSLEKFELNCSETKITIEGVSAIFEGIPKTIRYLNLDFSQVEFSKKAMSLFEEKLYPKLELDLVEGLRIRFEEADLAANKKLERRKKACSRMRGSNCC